MKEYLERLYKYLPDFLKKQEPKLIGVAIEEVQMTDPMLRDQHGWPRDKEGKSLCTYCYKPIKAKELGAIQKEGLCHEKCHIEHVMREMGKAGLSASEVGERYKMAFLDDGIYGGSGTIMGDRE